MKTILSSIIFAIILNQVQSFKGQRVECNDYTTFLNNFKNAFELSEFDSSKVTCTTTTELYMQGNVKKMKKEFDLKIYGCDAHVELDGYLKDISGKNLNNVNKFELTKIFDKVESCLPKK